MTEDTLEFDPFDPDDVAQTQDRQALTREEQVALVQQELRNRRDAYIRFFGGTGGAGDRKQVMSDLRRFCRGGQTAWSPDPREHALLTGRQEVYQRITDHLDLDFDDLWERYSKVPE